MTIEIYSSGLFHRWKYFNRIVQCRDSSSRVSRFFNLTNSALLVRSRCTLNELEGRLEEVEKERAESRRLQSG